ncbi:CP family cyanate transporter-like MFS transporter [Actinomadura luteofluorescens]|uniref:CP family cyanate transporter-like MFS transporter n=1 Tax=Actinomadura luteofluorescens TaxID=46163 RepID=A0A7Y9EBX3_9ACTN|nr:MFS transporter [Actinomadura luteofluorescens]NYD44868.1 CP family cyanate transporter-like MFS transporter [Actinomadura luteofluorescens]
MTQEDAGTRPGAAPLHDTHRAAIWGHRLAAIGLVLAAVNLRPAVTSVGPVLEEAQAGLGMSASYAGLLTSMPAVCFALIGFAAPWLAGRGRDIVIAASMAAVAVGLTVRPLAAGGALFAVLSALPLAGIAVANVLLPVVVKQRFPERVGAMTGLYSMALNVGASTAAATTVPLAGRFGGDWRIGLGAWALLAAIAVPPWLVLARKRASSTLGSPDTGPTVEGSVPRTRLTRSPTAWALALYFGLQATAAYIIIGWLPQIYRDAGLPPETAGLLFAVTSVLGIPLSFVLAAVAGRLRNQSGVAIAIGLFGLAGYGGLWAAPAAAPWVWAGLLGVANCSFPLVLTMIGLRGRDSGTVIRLSAFAQSTGYLLSIPGPVLVGALYEHSGNWRAPLVFMALLMLPQLAAGLFAGRDRQVG